VPAVPPQRAQRTSLIALSIAGVSAVGLIVAFAATSQGRSDLPVATLATATMAAPLDAATDADAFGIPRPDPVTPAARQRPKAVANANANAVAVKPSPSAAKKPAPKTPTPSKTSKTAKTADTIVPAAATPPAPVVEPATVTPPAVAPEPPPPLSHRERVGQTVEELSDAAAARTSTPITDEFGRLVGSTQYRGEKETKLPLRLSAVVNPTVGEPFAIIEDQHTGMVASYDEGGMLWPGVLPGVWVIDVNPGVVHLLDLETNSFEYLTFTKPPPRRPVRRMRPATRPSTRNRGRR
jgi:hypothetical protein